jgi:hypothetical protein
MSDPDRAVFGSKFDCTLSHLSVLLNLIYIFSMQADITPRKSSHVLLQRLCLLPYHFFLLNVHMLNLCGSEFIGKKDKTILFIIIHSHQSPQNKALLSTLVFENIKYKACPIGTVSKNERTYDQWRDDQRIDQVVCTTLCPSFARASPGSWRN